MARKRRKTGLTTEEIAGQLNNLNNTNPAQPSRWYNMPQGGNVRHVRRQAPTATSPGQVFIDEILQGVPKLSHSRVNRPQYFPEQNFTRYVIDPRGDTDARLGALTLDLTQGPTNYYGDPTIAEYYQGGALGVFEPQAFVSQNEVEILPTGGEVLARILDTVFNSGLAQRVGSYQGAYNLLRKKQERKK